MTSPRTITLFKWLLALTLIPFLAWRIVSVNVSQHLSELENPAALEWNANVPEIHLIQASAAFAADPDASLKSAMMAFWQNPADARPLMIIAHLMQKNGRPDAAARLVDIADRLNPRRPVVQLEIGNFWMKRGELQKGLQHWSVALETRPQLDARLFPHLLRIAESPAHSRLFAGLGRSTPVWMNKFFIYLGKNAVRVDTVKSIYKVLDDSPSGADPEVRSAFLNRLMSDGLWSDAYFAWLNGLGPERLAALGNVYDGSFEHDGLGEGYGWRFASGKSFYVDTQATYGAGKKKALRIEFAGPKSGQTQLATQYLLLDPGSYQLRGRVRIDDLEAVRGFSWSVACAGQSGLQPALVETQSFASPVQWTSFQSSFSVPAGCPVQQLRLSMHSVDAKTDGLAGSVWFDDMQISLVRP